MLLQETDCAIGPAGHNPQLAAVPNSDSQKNKI